MFITLPQKLLSMDVVGTNTRNLHSASDSDTNGNKQGTMLRWQKVRPRERWSRITMFLGYKCLQILLFFPFSSCALMCLLRMNALIVPANCIANTLLQPTALYQCSQPHDVTATSLKVDSLLNIYHIINYKNLAYNNHRNLSRRPV